MAEHQDGESLAEPIVYLPGKTPSIADLFSVTCRQLAQSDARIYRTVAQHIARTEEILCQAEAAIDLPQLARDLIQPPEIMAPTYNKQTRRSLENHCRLHGITGYSRLSKPQIVELLQANEIPPPPVPIEALTKAELIELFRQTIYHRNANDQQ